MRMLYTPVLDNVSVGRLKLLLLEVTKALVPPGSDRATFTVPSVLPLSRAVTCCPALPLKEMTALWPGRDVTNE